MARHRGSSAPGLRQPATGLQNRWGSSVAISQRKQGALQSAGRAALSASKAKDTRLLAESFLGDGPTTPRLLISACLPGGGSPLHSGSRPIRGRVTRPARSSPRGGGNDGSGCEEETSSTCSLQSSLSTSALTLPSRRGSPADSPRIASRMAPSLSNLSPVVERVPRHIASSGKPKWLFMANVGNNATAIWKLMRERPNWVSDSPRSLLGKPSMKVAAKQASREAFEDAPSSTAKVPPTLDTAFFAAKMPNFLWSQKLNLDFLNAVVQERNLGSAAIRLHNHFEGIAALCTKCGLSKSLSSFYLERGRDPYGAMPLSFVVNGSEGIQEWRKAFDAFDAASGQRMWLLKPGGWSNRGCDIAIYNSAEDVEEHLSNNTPKKSQDSADFPSSWVVQKYIESPLLIHGRKFDMRSYCLVTQEPSGGAFTVFFYEDAYLRTTSALYTTKSLDKMAHLNNDAVQNQGADYGKYEPANKMSLDDFQRYLDKYDNAAGAAVVREKIVPQMRSLMADAVRSVLPVLNPRQIDHCFEVFGFDFMVDANYRVWLIEVNTNPCLELCNTYLAYLIPKMLDEAMQLTVDRFFSDDSGQPHEIKANRGRNIGWTQIFNSDKDADADVSCKWLPCASGQEADLVSLGRDLLTSTEGSRKTRSSRHACNPKTTD